jgi:23S rRNA (adenine2030-N6)-methyltransferase
VLESLFNKDKPLCYIDTHAGLGFYDLSKRESKKTKEYETGISKIIDNQTKKPAAIEQYLKIVRSMNQPQEIIQYPGSPGVARALLRPQDKMILTELQPNDYQTLKHNFEGDKQVAVHHLDGYQGLKAFVPPMPRRGLVLIDPPFEQTSEFEMILKNVTMALSRWAQGIYLIWYPVKNRPQINYFQHQFERKIKFPYLITELNLYPDDSPNQLNGSGMMIINPPWQLDKKIPAILKWLSQELDQEQRGNTKLIIKK